MKLVRSEPWPDAVFHVLAHVRGTAQLPASVYDAAYVERVQRAVGSARERPLGEDAKLLEGLLASHAALGQAQLLGWLFGSAEQAEACARRDLSELGEADVAQPELLAPLVEAGAAVEVLRCAALLELPTVLALAPPAYDEAEVRRTLSAAVAVAPELARCRVMLVRSLGLRGRIHGHQLLVGAPCRHHGPSVSHVGWQASHEATVQEISTCAAKRAAALDERAVEQAALVLLAERAASAGRAAAHARWLAHFGASRPKASRSGLEPALRALLDALR